MPEYSYEAHCRKLARKLGASDVVSGPRLTINPDKATVIVLPREGRKITPRDKEYTEWKRKNC
ncbi:hypothetical protein [Oceanicola sp. 502str15]|uniref:hypothetical protein n=1 Tax=Oceanicola sp. 502str15 TaxID=2696061 RepID=UPI002094F2CA|nr:hypothetical protein [Oceanicola sp. 502str15]MCO6385022.1 hypothetical protein [Oceanicola sp. 502str15]